MCFSVNRTIRMARSVESFLGAIGLGLAIPALVYALTRAGAMLYSQRSETEENQGEDQ
jgi:hypothetical protein